jgi:hypothetical protein
MEKSDWLEVGLKVLGAYFLVSGLSTLWRTLLGLLAITSTTGAAAQGSGIALLYPSVELTGGLLLVFYRWYPAARIYGRKKPPVPDGLEDDPASHQRPEPPWGNAAQ